MKIPHTGVCILFDDSDHRDSPNRTYSQNQAFYMNIKMGGVEKMSPSYILEIMKKADCEHLVWVSKRIGENEDVHFTWVYAHELQHLLHDILCPGLSIIGCFLRLTYGCIDPNVKRYDIDIPTEFDCEKRAKGVVKEIFGEKACNSYIKDQLQNPERKECFEKLKDVEPSMHFNVEKETLDLLCRYKEQFKAQQKVLAKQGMFRHLNIEEICAKKSLESIIQSEMTDNRA